MVKIKEISKDIYRITSSRYPIYLRIRKGDISLVQPTDKYNEVKFDEDKYFGKGYPQELIIDNSEIVEVLEMIKKLLLIERL